MADPLGLINNAAGPGSMQSPQSRLSGGNKSEGPNFKDVLMDNIKQVNQLQADAEAAIEDLAAGRRDDVAGVMIAKQKADVAFKMLLQVRNKLHDAYDEVKQIRV
jgi:flagellar hook-basal body complex protein FliE